MYALALASALWALQPAEAAEAFQKRVKACAEKASKASVFIGGGSGFIISDDGYMLTNFHVSSTEAKETQVQLMDGRRLPAKKVAADATGDVALLKIECKEPLPYVEFGDSDALEPGQYVMAIGNPFRAGDAATGEKRYPTVTLGVVSGIHRHQNNYRDAIQTDAAVNPGNSGGMLVTLDAKVVGINGQIATRYMNRVNSGVGFAIPSVQIQRFLPAFKEAEGDGRVERGAIKGLSFDPWNRATIPWGTPKIAGIEPGSMADKAGFKAGDLVVGIEKYDIASIRRYEGVLCTYPEGSDVKVRVKRGEETLELKVTLERARSSRPVGEGPPAGSGWPGFTAEDADGGVRVIEVYPNSPAADAGIQPDDLVTRYGGRSIKTLKGRTGLYSSMGRHKPGDTIVVHVKRGEEEFDVDLRLAEAPTED